MAGNPNWIDGWSQDDLDSVVYKREVERKKWHIIATEMGRPLKTCYDRYGKVLRLRPAPVFVEPAPKPKPLSLHEELGIQTYVHRQAILCDPNGVHGSRSTKCGFHWFRVEITLAKVFA